MMLVMLLLTMPALAKGRLSRWQGIVLLVLYAGFCAFPRRIPAGGASVYQNALQRLPPAGGK